MTSSTPVRIGARGSPLSLTQTGLVRDALAAANPNHTFEIVPIVTTGDRIQDRRLQDAGGKGLFTKELDEAMMEGRIDLAVHSMKDLPIRLPPQIILACAPIREDPRDALICSAKVEKILDLPERARIGTASLRRQAQLLHLRPTFQISMLRGNVETRMRKVAEGEVDASLLAYSGLKRLGLSGHVKALLDPIRFPPAAGQGALAITSLEGSEAMASVLAPVEDYATRLEITAERAFLAALDGSCRTPIGALGRWSNGVLSFVGESLTPDGSKCWRRTSEAPCSSVSDAEALGSQLGLSLQAEAGDELYRDP